MPEFQLNAKMIGEQHKVWIVYSGIRRRFFRSFSENRMIFLQTPGFSPYEGIFEDTTEIRRHLRMADEIYRWIVGARGNPPSRNPRGYSGEVPPAKERGSRRFNQEVGNVQRLFTEVQVGDLIFSPSVGHYDEILIGEVVSPWDIRQVRQVPQLNNELVPYRKVNWFRAGLARRDFPPNVARALQNRHAVSAVDSTYYEEIYKKVYRAFIWGERSKIDFSADQYSSHDPLETFEGAFLIKYFVSAYAALESNNIQQFRQLPPNDAIIHFYNPDLVIEFTQNFNSPGKFSLIAVTILAMVVGISVQLMVDPLDLENLIGDINVVAGDGGATDDDVNEIREKVKDLIDGIGRDRLGEVKQNYGDKARENLQLDAEMAR